MPDLKFNPTGTLYLQSKLAIGIRRAFRERLKNVLNELKANKVSVERMILSEATLDNNSIGKILRELDGVAQDIKPLLQAILFQTWAKSSSDVQAAVGTAAIGNMGVAHNTTNKAFSYVKGLADERKLELQDILKNSISQGDSITTISEEIKDVFKTTSWRSEVIARTEVVRSYNLGSLETMKAAGVEKYEWIAALDERTRPTHRERNGKIFSVERGLQGLDPVPTMVFSGGKWDASESINCRCRIKAIIE